MSLLQSFSFRILAVSLVVLLLSAACSDNLVDLFYPELDIQTSGVADVLIIGGSHAGLSAALTLARQQIDFIIFDSNEPRNKWKTPTHIVPTWEGRSPDDIRDASRKELRRTGLARFVQTRVETIKPLEGNQTLFEVGDVEGRTWRGRKLLLAMGVEFAFPDIKGYEVNFPDQM